MTNQEDEITLKEFILQILEERDKAAAQKWEMHESAINAAFLSAEKAITKAENASEKRFESVNEFRAQLSDQATMFLPRAEFDRAFRDLSERIDIGNKTITSKMETITENLNSKIEGTGKGIDNKIENIVKIMNGKIDDLKTYKDITSGRSTGLNAGWIYLIGAISLLSTVIGIIFVFVAK